jgi:hypothetical protein
MNAAVIPVTVPGGLAALSAEVPALFVPTQKWLTASSGVLVSFEQGERSVCPPCASWVNDPSVPHALVPHALPMRFRHAFMRSFPMRLTDFNFPLCCRPRGTRRASGD